MFLKIRRCLFGPAMETLSSGRERTTSPHRGVSNAICPARPVSSSRPNVHLRPARATSLPWKRARGCSSGLHARPARPRDDVGDVVAADDSSSRSRAHFRRASLSLRRASSTLDPVHVLRTLAAPGQARCAGGPAPTDVTRDAPGRRQVPPTPRSSKERALLRSLVSAGGEIAGSVWTRKAKAARELVERGRTAHLRNRRRIEPRRGTRRRTPSASRHCRSDETICTSRTPTSARPAHRLHDLDEMTARPAAGRPDHPRRRAVDGQDDARANIAEYAALETARPVAVFSLEMSADRSSRSA